MEKKRCVSCNHWFVRGTDKWSLLDSNWNKRKYCSEKCNARYWKDKARGGYERKPKVEKKCPYCNKTYFAVRDNRKTCGSSLCLQKHGRYRKLSYGAGSNRKLCCCVCGINYPKTILEVHHLDKNIKNNGSNNLVILCSNHHRLLHWEKISVKEMKRSDPIEIIT